MKDKVLITLSLLLASSAAFQLTKILSLPEVPYDLIINQESYYHIVNEDKAQSIFISYDRLMDPPSKARIVIETKNAAKVTIDLLQKSMLQLDRAVAARTYRDSVQFFLATASAYQNEMLLIQQKITEEKWPPLDLDSISTLPEVLIDLAIEKSRCDILDINEHVISQYSSNTESSSLKFGDRVQESLKKTKSPDWIKGFIAFNPPVEMRVNQKDRVQVRISKKFLSGMIESMARVETMTVDSLNVGDIMLVKLSGEEFKIVAYDEEEQGVTNEGYSQWEFDVTPQQSGDLELFLKVGVVYFVPNLGPAKKYFPVYEKKIKVTVSAWQVVAGFATERWEFIVSSIVIPVGVWFFSRIRSRKKERHESNAKSR
ncbi:hypothetical protein BH10BAC4_BH10BAC4_15390 [soil metagenome]